MSKADIAEPHSSIQTTFTPHPTFEPQPAR
jgi:hypothetical protein